MLSANGEKMLYRQGRAVSLSQQPGSRRADHAGRGSGQLKLDAMEVLRRSAAEWKHMYHQVWRDERDFFYDPGLHGLNLEAHRKEIRAVPRRTSPAGTT